MWYERVEIDVEVNEEKIVSQVKLRPLHRENSRKNERVRSKAVS